MTILVPTMALKWAVKAVNHRKLVVQYHARVPKDFFSRWRNSHRCQGIKPLS